MANSNNKKNKPNRNIKVNQNHHHHLTWEIYGILKLQWSGHLLGVEEKGAIHVSETDGLFRDSAVIV